MSDPAAPRVDAARRALVEAVHDSPLQLVLAVTGGAVASIEDLLAVPGASRTVLEVTVPYASTSLADLLDFEPEQAVSEATARSMAERCLERAMELAGPESGESRSLAGVACTAALATDRPKRGEHRVHVAAAAAGGTEHWSVVLEKGARDRSGEDRVAADIVLNAIATLAGLGSNTALDLPDEQR